MNCLQQKKTWLQHIYQDAEDAGPVDEHVQVFHTACSPQIKPNPHPAIENRQNQTSDTILNTGSKHTLHQLITDYS